MFRSRREVDRHVEQLEAKIVSEAERNLKALSIAKLYFNVHEYEMVKYISVRQNSSTAFKLLGQICEGLQQREKAIQAYKTAFELDQSHKDIILKICELLTSNINSSGIDSVQAKYDFILVI